MGQDVYVENIRRGLDLASVGASEAAIATLAEYLGLLAKWNRRINLTSFVLDPPTEAAIERLIVEPVAATRHVRTDDRLAVDIGSGGGSPALPMKIASPKLHMTLVEARARKCAFLREAVRVLGLRDVNVITARFDASWTDVAPGTLDLVTLRAVRMDSELSAAVAELLKPGGRLFWFRGLVEQQNVETPKTGIQSMVLIGSDPACSVLQKPS